MNYKTDDTTKEYILTAYKSGIKYSDIARQLRMKGMLSASGKPFTKGRVYSAIHNWQRQERNGNTIKPQDVTNHVPTPTYTVDFGRDQSLSGIPLAMRILRDQSFSDKDARKIAMIILQQSSETQRVNN